VNVLEKQIIELPCSKSSETIAIEIICGNGFIVYLKVNVWKSFFTDLTKGRFSD